MSIHVPGTPITSDVYRSLGFTPGGGTGIQSQGGPLEDFLEGGRFYNPGPSSRLGKIGKVGKVARTVGRYRSAYAPKEGDLPPVETIEEKQKGSAGKVVLQFAILAAAAYGSYKLLRLGARYSVPGMAYRGYKTSKRVMASRRRR